MLVDGFELQQVRYGRIDTQWSNQFGERGLVSDRCAEMCCVLNHSSGRTLELVFRAYDEGAALRYVLPADADNCGFDAERTEFRLPAGTLGYEEHSTEGPYKLTPVNNIAPQCQWPLTLCLPNKSYAALCEAANHSFPQMLLSRVEGVKDALVTTLNGRNFHPRNAADIRDLPFILRAGEKSPWRGILLGRTPGELLENNYMLLCLNPPGALPETDWIKPGKVMRDMVLSTSSSKEIIDFADKAGLDYVHLDSGWYGRQDEKTGDATKVRRPNLDLQEIIAYGKQKGIGLIVYVDRRQIKTQRDELFKLYEAWGIAGVKIGFIEVGTQQEQEFISETIAKAAEHRLMLDIHDNWRDSGTSRTYPNLMTIEGIRGNENMPTAAHNCTLPFTRYLSGAGDYTVCYYSPKVKTTHAHQLAMAVVSFSPLQWLYWYDAPSKYQAEPEIEFFREIPTVWDETRVLEGEIGRYATIARRSGQAWFVGSLNADSRTELNLPLEFLDKGVEYDLTVYYDDPEVDSRTNVAVRRERVTSSSSLQAPLLKSGGAAVWIRPAHPEGQAAASL
jgi:alpha-glucosidase